MQDHTLVFYSWGLNALFICRLAGYVFKSNTLYEYFFFSPHKMF
jgi:hypothetical protein